jgi:hypothetical protein
VPPATRPGRGCACREQEQRETRRRVLTAAGMGDLAERSTLDADLDPSSTNLYVSNLFRSIDERALMDAFGRVGPLASVKILWPRGDEAATKTHNSGFVAYMVRPRCVLRAALAMCFGSLATSRVVACVCRPGRVCVCACVAAAHGCYRSYVCLRA